MALLAVLISPAMRPPARELAALVNQATSFQAGVRREYADAAELLDGIAQERDAASFAALELSERQEVLDGLLWRFPGEQGDRLGDLRSKTARRLKRLIRPEQLLRLRHLVIRDLLRRFHIQQLARYTGYANHPGLPGHPRGYVEPPP